MQYLQLDQLLDRADLVFTAEGGIDFQTPQGKIPVEVAQRAKARNLPVAAIAGTIGKDAQVSLDQGIDSYFSIVEAPCTLPEAFDHATEWLINTAEQTMRSILIGQKLQLKF
jgi:glycerate kinase